MFFIYSLNLENLAVKLYDFCRTKDGISNLLDTVATNFICHEEGERRAESPYRDDLTDEHITDEGYFLRHSSDAPNQIDVHFRKTIILPGRVWNSYDLVCKKVMQFSVTEASLGLPVECTGKGVITQTFSSAKEAQQQFDHLEELKLRLAPLKIKIAERIQADRLKVENQQVDLPSDSDTDEEELENPISRLKKVMLTTELQETAIVEKLMEVCTDITTELQDTVEDEDTVEKLIEVCTDITTLSPVPPPRPLCN
uniref:Uncharacterized protein n=1 Tax=Marseillevirus LCMAC201 TaxID=2506605 RepID=A0A481YX90_9VIRU|nr:MAG: hypothetical protein LCMAC201_04070 [Marseillevirus LCMAC201]